MQQLGQGYGNLSGDSHPQGFGFSMQGPAHLEFWAYHLGNFVPTKGDQIDKNMEDEMQYGVVW